jgi:TPR repeat protein
MSQLWERFHIPHPSAMSVRIGLALTVLLVLGGILIWLNVLHGPEKLANDAEEQYRIGTQYFYGTGVDRDYAEALRRFRKAAAQGHAGAQPRAVLELL